MPRLAEVAYRRAEPDAIGIIERRWPHACGIRMVVVGAVYETCGFAGVVKGHCAGYHQHFYYSYELTYPPFLLPLPAPQE